MSCVSHIDLLFVCLFVCRTKIDELNQKKEEEMKAMNIRIQKLQSDLMAATQVSPQELSLANAGRMTPDGPLYLSSFWSYSHK